MTEERHLMRQLVVGLEEAGVGGASFGQDAAHGGVDQRRAGRVEGAQGQQRAQLLAVFQHRERRRWTSKIEKFNLWPVDLLEFVGGCAFTDFPARRFGVADGRQLAPHRHAPVAVSKRSSLKVG